jgi:hypothetical protein
VRTMLEDEFKRSVVELRELAARTIGTFKELLDRAGAAFQLEMAIEKEWSTLRRPSRHHRAEYLAQVKFIRSLAKDHTKWLKDNPELDAIDINSWREELQSASSEQKVAFLEGLRLSRVDRLERQLPEFRDIVDRIEASVQRLQQIVAR